MHIPTCPVKMAGTLQRRCANCHYVFTGAIFGVWFFMVKQGISLRFNDMPTRLPLGSLLVPAEAGTFERLQAAGKLAAI